LARLAGVGLALLLSAASARAADLRVTIFEYGLYTMDSASERQAADGLVDSTVENICHYATTTVVPLKQGVHFGFRFRIEGLAADETVDLSKVGQFPRMVRPAGAHQPLSTFRRRLHVPDGGAHYIGYGLDYDWEMMSGRWTFGIYDGDRKLGGMAFDVIEGAETPARSSSEASCFKVSSR
jgi:hypothetical protein